MNENTENYKYLTCKEFIIQSTNLTEFVIENQDDEKMFLSKLSLIRYSIMYHMMDCPLCMLFVLKES